MSPITVTLSGNPVPWARAGGRGHVRFTPKKQRDHMGFVRLMAQQEMNGRAPIDQPVELVMRAVMEVPKSWSLKKRVSAIRGELRPGKTPDLSNLEKLIEDAFNGVVYRDDCLICRKVSEKVYGPQPLTVVTVRAL